MGKMLVTRGIVFLKNSDKEFSVIAAKGINQNILNQSIIVESLPRSIKSIGSISKKNAKWLELLKAHQQTIIIPIFSQERIVGYFSLGERFSEIPYSPADKKLIDLLVNLSGSAIEKALIINQVKEVNRNLDRKVQELNTLFDLGKEFNIGLDEKKVVRLITFALLGQIGIKKYAICLLDGEALSIVGSRLEKDIELNSILPKICDLEKSSIVTDLLKHKKYKIVAAQLIQMGISALIPMHIQKKTKGMILLGEKLNGGLYTNADLEFLYSLGNLAIISIENAKLFKTAIEKQRMEDELNIAREIQRGLLPETLPSIDNFDIAAVTIPSKEVGGDYYDVIKRNENEYIIAIADVSGKGTPAALLMANVQAALRALSPHCKSISETTGQINDLICASTGNSNKFITFFWGILESNSRQFRYTNAGHNPPIVISKEGKIKELNEGGLILGVFKTSTPYEESVVTLMPGDVLIMYTDGISEAMNLNNEQYSEERLLKLLKESKQVSSREIIKHVQKDLDSFTQGALHSDDITILAIKAV